MKLSKKIKKYCVKFILCAVLFFAFTSCNSLILRSKASHARELKVFEKGDTTVVFVGMTHLAKPQFFSEVKTQIDSLRKEGFIFMKEGVRMEEATTAQTKDTLYRKFRQLMGFTIGNYADKENKSLPKYYRNDKYVMQKDTLIGLLPSDLLTDMTYNQMIAAHEEKYGTIKLTDCDFKTALKAKYDCKDGNAYKNNFYVVDIVRSDYLHEQVLASKHKKIAVVYGASHFKWFYAAMVKSGYTYKNKKLKFG